MDVPGSHPSLQAAWDAIPGDGTGDNYIIRIEPGTYFGNSILSGKTAQVIQDCASHPSVVLYRLQCPFPLANIRCNLHLERWLTTQTLGSSSQGNLWNKKLC